MKKLSLRLFVVYLGLLCWGLIIIVHIFSVVNQKGKAYKGEFADTLTVGNRYFQIKTAHKQGFRGNVYAEEGEMLSATIPIYDIYWELDKVGLKEKDSALYMSKIDTIISLLCQITPKVTRETYEKRLKERYVNYYQQCKMASIQANSKDKEIQKQGKEKLRALKDGVKGKYDIIKISVDINPASWVRRATWDQIRNLSGKKGGGIYYAGFRADEHYVHHSVYENYASSVIGIKTDNGSYSGIEGYYDSLLAGENKEYRRLYVNRVLVPLRENQHIMVNNGCDIVTTINIDMQRMVEQSLREKLEEIQPLWGCVVLMETKTGAIKAISNLTLTKDGKYEDITDHVITENYEPGSTFKTVALLAALDSKRVFISDTVNCTKNRRLSVQRAFEISDNDGIYNVTKEVYKHIDQFFLKLNLMGLNEDLQLDVSNARYMPLEGKKLKDVDYNHVTHGYAVKLPPIYMMAFYNSIANNGLYVKPYLVKEISYPNGDKIEKKPHAMQFIASPSAISQIKQCLEGVVTHGTAIRARDAYYLRTYKTDSTVRPLIAGKTGTARLYDDKTRQYSGNNNSSFIGYFPAENPQYTCMVMFSGAAQDAGIIAAPVCLDIAEKIQNRNLSLQSYRNRDAAWNKLPSVPLGNVFDLYTVCSKMGYKFQKMPNAYWVGISPVNGSDSLMRSYYKEDKNLYQYLKGSSAKDAVYLLEQRGYKVHIEGVGAVSDIVFENDNAYLTLKNSIR